ncbi:hypothetical protein RJ639_001408 [Escallonia herrerae]|uniref:Uncharacterized protein n=1 Tax=Escallonia herrerae TaxID=1293975 RepID=A0AA88X848_9ASTE|nr:hypothetical protein RJ639_001408 [Escallonia herrerae]
MASSSFSKPHRISFHLFPALLIIFLLLGSSAATRPVRSTVTDADSWVSLEDLKHFRRKHEYEGMVFNVLPKGVPIPPSAPSKRHNSVVNSSPEN